MRRIARCSVEALAVLFGAAVSLVCGCGASPMLAPEEEVPQIERQYRRVGGSSTKIYAGAKRVFEKMEIQVTGERTGTAMIGKMSLAQKPVYLYFKIHGRDWVNVRFYNLSRGEEDKWRARFFKELEAAVRGTPAEREHSGRSSRG